MNIGIIGTGGHAFVVAEAAELSGHSIAGYLGEANPQQQLNHPLLGSDNDLPDLWAAQTINAVVIGIGDNYRRQYIAKKILAMCPEITFVTIIHPSAIIAPSAHIGYGTVILSSAIVCAQSTIGNHCLVNTCASLDHDSVMGDYASLGPNATTGGNCSIGASSAIGISATVIHNLSVGRHTVIGAAALVTKSIGDSVIAYGTPARIISTRADSDPYL